MPHFRRRPIAWVHLFVTLFCPSFPAIILFRPLFCRVFGIFWDHHPKKAVFASAFWNIIFLRAVFWSAAWNIIPRKGRYVIGLCTMRSSNADVLHIVFSPLLSAEKAYCPTCACNYHLGWLACVSNSEKAPSRMPLRLRHAQLCRCIPAGDLGACSNLLLGDCVSAAVKLSCGVVAAFLRVSARPRFASRPHIRTSFLSSISLGWRGSDGLHLRSDVNTRRFPMWAWWVKFWWRSGCPCAAQPCPPAAARPRKLQLVSAQAK